ncbi:MAG: hypothetical protein L3J34_12380 [Flavobacteriaceae bacterium]|nr:hypothetical protein [Flavobacteriaceae bacterium]
MNNIKTILLSIIISISVSNNTNAQFLKKLKNQVQQAAEQVVIDKVAEKGAQEAGKAMDSILNIDSNYQAKNQEQLLNSFFQSGENIDVEDIYNFDTNVIMEMVIEEKKNPTKIDYSMWFTKNDSYMATEINNMETKESKSQKIPGGMLPVIPLLKNQLSF